jgi:hypothetical protein
LEAVDAPIPPETNESSSRRLQALKNFSATVSEAVRLGPLAWDESNPDLRALAINSSVRRQRDAFEGAIALGDAGQGHLAVAFVRAFLEERMWVAFLGSIARAEANELLLAMGRWDAVRALTAQRDYIGDLEMTVRLWYPPGFVDACAATLPDVKAELGRLRDRWGWKGTIPSAGWVADQVSLRDEYEYLHSATSRALHFSAGEIMRRGWGMPGGILITDKAEFRAHLAEFAYDQLWRQHLGTLLGAVDFLAEAAISAPSDFWSNANRDQLISELKGLGRVPLVHAYEWNLTPPPAGTRLMWAVVMQAQSADVGRDTAGRDEP